MQNMFQGATTFNEDISSWDISNVNNFAFFFYKATTFNQDISAWDMSNYTNMNNIFNGATAFNQDISAWDVSEATGMNSIFNGAANFNQDLSTWCVPGISSLPLNFGNAGTNPVWGTCPNSQRVISGNEGWRLLSFPMTGGTVETISDDTAIQGIVGGKQFRLHC